MRRACSDRFMNRRVARYLSVAVPVALFGLGIAARRQLVGRWSAGFTAAPPFTLESALHFRRIEMLRTGTPLPRVDTAVEYPDGVRTFENDTVGAEYPVAALARLFPSRVPPETRLRWISVLWFCLGIPVFYGWIARASGSRTAGALAGVFYAAGLGSVIRSTGWEIQRENFAMPFLLMHLAAEAVAADGGRTVKRWTALSAAALATALLCWDMIQFYLGMRVLWWVASWLRRPRRWEDSAWIATGISLAAAAVAGIAHPYYRAHGFLGSPLLTVPVACAALWLWKRRRGGAAATPSRLEIAAAVAVGLAVSALALNAYRESYAHFGDLLLAKLRYLNRKPADPSELNFAQRMLWTPALHSTTPRLALELFPALLPLTMISLVVFFLTINRRGSVSACPRFIIFSHIISGLAFALFFRFHVFFAIFGAAGLGFVAAVARRAPRRWISAAALAGLTLGAAAEARWTWTTDWGPAGAGYGYGELAELSEWLNARGNGRPVLANFGLSGFVLAYGHCPILLHPKFETPGIRRRVEEYLTELYKGTETGFRDWAATHGAVWYVHAVGELWRGRPEHRMSYMVNAQPPPTTAPVWGFELWPQRMTRFRYEWGNARYRVFRVVRPEDEAIAAELSERAAAALADGRVADAELLAERALRLYAGVAGAAQTLDHARALRAAGFESAAESP